MPEEMFSLLVDSDDNLECFGSPTETDFLNEIGWENEASNPETSDEQDVDLSREGSPCPSRTEAIKAFHTLKSYIEAKNFDCD